MRIDDKIKEIENYIAELSEIGPKNFEEYNDIKTKAACERYFEKIIESVVDLSLLIIKQFNFNLPEDDKKAFDVLAQNLIITEELSTKLKEAKGMRNIIAHEYGKIDDQIVFESISKDLIIDISEFLRIIKKIRLE